MKHAQGISAPEPSANMPIPSQTKTVVPDEVELMSMTQDRAEMLDHNARLYFELDPNGNGTNLYSFYGEYQDYLDERNLVDVSLPFISVSAVL